MPAHSGKIHSNFRSEWATPQWLYDELNQEFGFVHDAAASADNAKHRSYWAEDDSALDRDWSAYFPRGSWIWCNPPYGRGMIDWLDRAVASASNGVGVVMLLPANTDTGWFHDLVVPYAEVRFLRGRVQFEPPPGVERKNGNPGGSMVCVFRPVTGLACATMARGAA